MDKPYFEIQSDRRWEHEKQQNDDGKKRKEEGGGGKDEQGKRAWTSNHHPRGWVWVRPSWLWFF